MLKLLCEIEFNETILNATATIARPMHFIILNKKENLVLEAVFRYQPGTTAVKE